MKTIIELQKYIKELPFEEKCLMLDEKFSANRIDWLMEWRMFNPAYSQFIAANPYIKSRYVFSRLDLLFGKNGWSTTIKYPNTYGDSFGLVAEMNIEGLGTRSDGSNAGDNEPMKSAVTGALKRCAMQFGIGRYLYELGQCSGEITDKNDYDYIYYHKKTKERFYWKRPILPEWALPTESDPIGVDEVIDISFYYSVANSAAKEYFASIAKNPTSYTKGDVWKAIEKMEKRTNGGIFSMPEPPTRKEKSPSNSVISDLID
jgi:hypothetical protein